MKVVCPECGKENGEVLAYVRFIFTAHCSYCGKDWGQAVEPETPAAAAPAPTETSAPAA